ncbi:MAG: FG-GAP-like repeat-containing protein [Bacteroidota bacterium]|nr:FG-GAP-like repeat-containing protein [Bacteroidota bacterium]MDP4228983.1 FG-GAP-like repeat-containing protein [Bacteroidota bacterium]MDP4235785.1 FG-GAP-like repeat-containing protein [Bacteroidota bacterium]
MIISRVSLIALLLASISGVSIAQFRFEDATDNTKIFQQSNGTENIGPGVVVFDFNNDGWEDLYLPGGLNPDKLYQNMKDGTFTDIADSTFRVHNDFRVNTRAGTAFDFDGDGLTDLYLCTQGNDILWKNNGDGTFSSVGDKAGILTSLDRNESNCASYGDFDGDGDNDLYVARWVDEMNVLKNPDGSVAGYAYKGFPNRLYVNNGNGTFDERAKELGVEGDTGCSNIALFFDYDRDGDLDLFIGNDFGVELMPNRVFKNMLMETGVPNFVRVDTLIGMELHLFCMGICPNDYNRDGQFDFYETTVGPDHLMENRNNRFFDVSNQTNLPTGYAHGRTDSMTTSWTPLFADFDNDGWEDGFITHGFIPVIPPWNAVLKDTSVFLRNVGGTFENCTDSAGVQFYLRGKGAAVTDYDHDGKVDIVVGSLGQQPGVKSKDFKVFHNITSPENSGHWMQLKFTAVRTAKEAIGTIVDVWAGGAVRSRQISTGGGQASCNSLTAYIGLGKFSEADSIIVYWPADRHRNRTINKYYHVAADAVLHFTEDTTVLTNSVPSALGMKKVRIYPSPAHNTVNIDNLEASTLKHFEIYDLLGIRRIDVQGTETTFSLSVNTLKPGCYLLRITSNGNVTTRQFIKQ